ncbi:MAG: hypothetical protein ACOYVF_10710 [Candidatus Zixiibacteriota bacterium]
MKRFMTLLVLAAFGFMILLPPVTATPYDPFEPKDDRVDLEDDPPEEADPWGELESTGGGTSGKTIYLEGSLWFATTSSIIEYFFFGTVFTPKIIIVKPQPTVKNVEDGTIDENQVTNNTDSGTSARPPRGD